MEKATLYSTSCPKCKVLEAKLRQAGIEFDLVEDREEVVKVGEEHGILSAPILEIGGECFDFIGALKKIKEAN